MAVVFNGGHLCCGKVLVINAPTGAAANYRINGVKSKGFVLQRQNFLKACQAASSSSPAPAPSSFDQQFSVPEANALPDGYTVFRDEAKGIICYRSPTGEITCEGIDEGPHFQPPPQYFRLQGSQFFTAKSRDDENYVNGAGI